MCDAALPGHIAVVLFRPGEAGELVHWSRSDRWPSIVAAELHGAAKAARVVRRQKLNDPVIVTDARVVYDFVRRGVSRNDVHAREIVDIRTCAEVMHMAWVPSERNVADGLSRARTRYEAERLAAGATDPLPDMTSAWL